MQIKPQTNVGEDVGKKEPLYTVGGKVQSVGKQDRGSSKN
jgi:hypothetical protein